MKETMNDNKLRTGASNNANANASTASCDNDKPFSQSAVLPAIGKAAYKNRACIRTVVVIVSRSI